MPLFDKEEYFTCMCGDFDHTLRFILDLTDDKYSKPTIYTEIRLTHYRPWWKRIIPGIKYMFGSDVRHAHSCWEINEKSDDPDKMIDMLQRLKIALKENKLKTNEKSEEKETK